MNWIAIVFLVVAFLLTMTAFLAGLMIGFRLRHNLPPVEIPIHRPATPPEPTPAEQAAEDVEAKSMIQLWTTLNEVPHNSDFRDFPPTIDIMA